MLFKKLLKLIASNKLKESYIKNKKGILLIMCSALLACFGQYFWKKYNIDVNYYYLIIGFTLYGCGALIMIFAYKYGSLSVIQPMMSSNYIFGLLIGILFLKEAFTITKLIGILIITLGLFLIGGSDS